ncbi:hypothetical protein YC2023_048460 [Brassica napus]
MGIFLRRLLRRLKLKVNIKSDKKLDGQHRGSWFQRHAEQRGINKGYEAMAFPEFARSHFPKNTNPKMVLGIKTKLYIVLELVSGDEVFDKFVRNHSIS